MNALIDLMIYGGINGVEPPYNIWIKGTANLPEIVKAEIAWLIDGARCAGGAEKASQSKSIPNQSVPMFAARFIHYKKG